MPNKSPTLIFSIVFFHSASYKLFQLPVEESVHIPRPLSVNESGSSLFINSYDPGVGLNKLLSNIIQIKGTNQIMDI